jgi:hypothetical protein
MRLLNAKDGEIREFISDENVPRYAILSHTWYPTVDEVILQDWKNLSSGQIAGKKGYAKIQHCREQALEDGLQWVWIDT